MSKIIGRSPTRVDLAGGTLDLWPLYNFVGGARTINVAISIWTEASIDEREDDKIELISEDLNFRKLYSSLDECLADEDPKLALLRVHIGYWRPRMGFTLTTRSESPIGGGLGGSSSLTISLLKAFSQLMGAPISDPHQMVKIAHNMEAQVLNTPTGTQDYYPAVLGGLNIIEYGFEGPQVETFTVGDSALAKNFLLVYTGKAHHSGLNNFEVLTRAVNRDRIVTDALKRVKEVADLVANVCRKNEFSQLPSLFNEEFLARVNLAKSFSSPEIDELKMLSLQAGADAVKICGAGGGGCVLVWVAPEQRERVVTQCQKAGYQILDVGIVDVL